MFFAKQMTAQWWSHFFRTLFTYMYIYFTRPTKKHGLSNMFRWNPHSFKVCCETRLRWSTQRAASSLAIHDFQTWWLMMVDELFSCFVYSVDRYSHVRCVCIVYTLTLQRPLIFGVFQENGIFSESTFFEIKYCFSHASDVHSWRYSWNRGNQIHVTHCQLATHCCRCHFCFGCLKAQEQRFPNYWFAFTCLMPWFRSSLLWVLDVLCSFIIAHLRTCGCIAQFWWQLVLGRFANTTQTCKGLFSFKRTFFCWAVQTKRTFFQKNAPFFHVRPSIRQNCFSSWHHKIRASGCAQTPCVFSHKCRNVQMFAPAAHYKKQAKVLYIDTNCGSKAVQPWSFSYVPGSEWCARVPDPTSDRTSTKRSHDLA